MKRLRKYQAGALFMHNIITNPNSGRNLRPEYKEGGFPERYRKLGFSGVNKPKKTPNSSKSHAVVIKDNNNYKLIRFGQQGVSGSPKKAGESEKSTKRRNAFKARHAKNIAKGKTSAAY